MNDFLNHYKKIKLGSFLILITSCFLFLSCQETKSSNTLNKLHSDTFFNGKNEKENKQGSIVINEERKSSKSYDSIKCNLKYLIELENKINNPEDEDILNFLYTFDISCTNNIEYSEYSNELLFQCLYKHPKQFIKLLNSNTNNLKIDTILKELENPVNDKYLINTILEKVNKLNYSKIKENITKALSKAQSKSSKE
ncbi:hypothetical protein [Flavobacterium sp. NRK1]|uniref:hypothetical protein n=1 Tax=Flavobacterium sp. NRK1 TaxID=2954929 RepID=UPI002093403B|nr:hypothetical protein [Flavobacterium sp. NRK1]MCO6148484.1 hypothetical protein [Flavobacterium sp. NRK1]